MLTSEEIGKLAKFIENRKAYPFILSADNLAIIVDKDKISYSLIVTDEFDRILLLVEDKLDSNKALEVREYYTSQSECDLVETALRGILC
jgi:hypothetical protein